MYLVLTRYLVLAGICRQERICKLKSWWNSKWAYLKNTWVHAHIILYGSDGTEQNWPQIIHVPYDDFSSVQSLSRVQLFVTPWASAYIGIIFLFCKLVEIHSKSCGFCVGVNSWLSAGLFFFFFSILSVPLLVTQSKLKDRSFIFWRCDQSLSALLFSGPGLYVKFVMVIILLMPGFSCCLCKMIICHHSSCKAVFKTVGVTHWWLKHRQTLRRGLLYSLFLIIWICHGT